ncbi:DNA-directed RNA polymerase III subunit RPC4 [Homalodisca vitripennis]|nr:DNA-directed RNA polymerase III subunit RPC4 [Homalodisca vitripennis]
MMKQKESTKQPLSDINIKTEPGTSTTPVIQRLPSLRPPRDLSLSAYSLPNLNQSKNKKVYVPNLNVQRIKPTGNATIKADPAKPKLAERPERERGRGKKNLIQLNHGVFADGIPGQKNVGRGRPSGGSGDKADNVLRKPTLKLKVIYLRPCPIPLVGRPQLVALAIAVQLIRSLSVARYIAQL